MSSAPIANLDLAALEHDPYPTYARLQQESPVAYVPELNSVMMVRRSDIFAVEKMTEHLSVYQPDSMMTRLMGENMMRKDGEAHAAERKAIFPAVSPRTVKNVWLDRFKEIVTSTLDDIEANGGCEVMEDFAKPVASQALCVITGLTNMDWQEMDRVSRGMIEGVSNFAKDAAIEAECISATTSIDDHITARLAQLSSEPDSSLISVQLQAGLSEDQMRANVKLAISGGQNEPKHAITGTIWALLSNPAQLQLVRGGEYTWTKAFEEYARWMSLVGMSPFRVASPFEHNGITFETGDSISLNYAAANRDPEVFENPHLYDITRDTGKSIHFGAGPHFCAGAWAARALIAEAALPQFFERLTAPRLRDDNQTTFAGWAFRAPDYVACQWSP